MIVEQARIAIKPGHESAFEGAVAEALKSVLPRAEGYQGGTLLRCIEDPSVYICALRWETVEHHTVTFRGGPLFGEWRGLIGDHLADTPGVLHFSETLKND